MIISMNTLKQALKYFYRKCFPRKSVDHYQVYLKELIENEKNELVSLPLTKQDEVLNRLRKIELVQNQIKPKSNSLLPLLLIATAAFLVLLLLSARISKLPLITPKTEYSMSGTASSIKMTARLKQGQKYAVVREGGYNNKAQSCEAIVVDRSDREKGGYPVDLHSIYLLEGSFRVHFTIEEDLTLLLGLTSLDTKSVITMKKGEQTHVAEVELAELTVILAESCMSTLNKKFNQGLFGNGVTLRGIDLYYVGDNNESGIVGATLTLTDYDRNYTLRSSESIELQDDEVELYGLNVVKGKDPHFRFDLDGRASKLEKISPDGGSSLVSTITRDITPRFFDYLYHSGVKYLYGIYMFLFLAIYRLYKAF